MRYKLLYTKSAFKDIQKLDTIVKKRIKKKIEGYIDNSLHSAKRLVNSAIGTYRWRVSTYRIIFDRKGDTIIILRVAHRREIYK